MATTTGHDPAVTTTTVRQRLRDMGREYSGQEVRPLRGYATSLATYSTAVAALVVAVRRSGATLPERPSWSDLALGAIATHKASRLLTKAPVTSPIRAPFTRYRGPAADAELHEEARGHGVQHAVGELVTCPFCLGQWIATAFVFGLIAAPRQTRWTAGLFTCLAGSDVLQFGYAAIEQAV
jgi:hypothetical protein